jgi:peptidoglycan/LPS O-acetylase OafA/YrhL
VKAAPSSGRIEWLDGVRGCAALFVVLHHMWLAAWPFYPETHGPWWLGWLLYGQLAVAVFIVVSGYSLTVAPVRKGGGQLVGGAGRFFRRRAWRIIPPYLAALVVSMVLFLVVLHPETEPGTAAKSFFVHAALLQNVIGNVPPNGTFWSISIEWQIYFLFPVILLLIARVRPLAAVALVYLAVIAAHLLAVNSELFSKIDHLGIQFLALFALGVLAAWLAHRPSRFVTRPVLLATAVLSLGGTAALAIVQGSRWMTEHWFGVDLLFGLGVTACLLLASTTERRWANATLGSRPLVFLGLFSYSVYLIHAPLLAMIDKLVVDPLGLAPGTHFAVLLAGALPVLLVACYGFFLVFERPFLTRRGFASLRSRLRGLALTRPGPLRRVKEEVT